MSSTEESLQRGVLKKSIIRNLPWEHHKHMGGLWPDEIKLETSRSVSCACIPGAMVMNTANQGSHSKAGSWLICLWCCHFTCELLLSFIVKQHFREWKVPTPFRANQTLRADVHSEDWSEVVLLSEHTSRRTIPRTQRHSEYDPAQLVLGKKERIESGPVNNVVCWFVPKTLDLRVVATVSKRWCMPQGNAWPVSQFFF